MLTVELKWSYSGCIVWDQVIRFVVIITACYIIIIIIIIINLLLFLIIIIIIVTNNFFDSYVFYFKTSISHALPLHFTVIFLQFNSIPIFLTGLPPQGFRRLWKARENSSTEKLTKVNSMTEA